MWRKTKFLIPPGGNVFLIYISSQRRQTSALRNGYVYVYFPNTSVFRIRNFDYRHFLSHIAVKSWLDNCKWRRKPEYVTKFTALSQVTGNFLICPGWDANLGSGEGQLTVSGNALDQMPSWQALSHQLPLKGRGRGMYIFQRQIILFSKFQGQFFFKISEIDIFPQTFLWQIVYQFLKNFRGEGNSEY